MKQLTSDLRERMSEKNIDFTNLDNDSWRKVYYMSPAQQQIKTLLEHQRQKFRERDALLQDMNDQQDGLYSLFPEQKQIQVGRELKCASHARILDPHEYWSYQLP